MDCGSDMAPTCESRNKLEQNAFYYPIGDAREALLAFAVMQGKRVESLDMVEGFYSCSLKKGESK
jgi:hypothetical protein